MRVTKIFTFETAHRLLDYQGACSNIHGHSYRLEVSVEGLTNGADGMLVDFKDLKKIVERHVVSMMDHALVLEERDPLLEMVGKAEVKVVTMMRAPTAENMLALFDALLRLHLPGLAHLKLYETETSYAELSCL